MSVTDLLPWRRSSSPTDVGPMASLQRDINKMLEDFFHNGGFFMEGVGAFVPSLDITETEKAVDLTAELPGLGEKDITVNVSDDGDVLTIEGEKRSETESRTETMFRSERRFGRFRRIVPLPSRVDTQTVEATCKDGILKVHMNRLPASEQRTRQIPVKGA